MQDLTLRPALKMRMRSEMGNGKWEMGNGKWEMGDPLTPGGGGRFSAVTISSRQETLGSSA